MATISSTNGPINIFAGEIAAKLAEDQRNKAAQGGAILQTVDLKAPASCVMPMNLSRSYNHYTADGGYGLDGIANINNLGNPAVSLSTVDLFALGIGWTNSFNVIMGRYSTNNISTKTSDCNYYVKLGDTILTFDKNMKCKADKSSAVIEATSTGYVITVGPLKYYLKKHSNQKQLLQQTSLNGPVTVIENNADWYVPEKIVNLNGGSIEYEYEYNIVVPEVSTSGVNGTYQEKKYLNFNSSRVKAIKFKNPNREEGKLTLTYQKYPNNPIAANMLTYCKTPVYYRVSGASITSGSTTKTVSYQIDSAGKLTAMTDANSKTTTYTYTRPAGVANDLLYTATDPDERKQTFDYQQDSRFMQPSTLNPRSYVAQKSTVGVDSTTFYNQNNYTATLDNKGTSDTADDELTEIQSATDENGNRVITSSRKGKPISRIVKSSDGSTLKEISNETWTWDPKYDLPRKHTLTLPGGQTITDSYYHYTRASDSWIISQCSTTIAQAGKQEKYSTTTVYDRCSREEKRITSKETWNSLGKKTSGTSYQYNAAGQLSCVRSQEIGSDLTVLRVLETAYEYTNGELSKIIVRNEDASGTIKDNITTITRTDPILAPYKVRYTTTSNGLTVTKEYNKYTGTLLTETDANGAITTYEYNDPKNRLTKVTYPNGASAQYAYDDTYTSRNGVECRKETYISPLGAVASSYYNKLGQLVEVDNPAGLPDEFFTYNHYGKLTNKLVKNIDEESYEQTATYDAYYHDRQTGSSSPAGTTSSSVDEATGQVTSTVNGLTTVSSFDLLSRMTNITYPDSSTVAAAYSPAGRLATITDGKGGQLQYSTTNAGNTVQTTEHGDANNMTFDRAGNLLSHSVAQATVYNNTFDAANRLTLRTAGDDVRYYYYDQSEPEAGMTLVNQKGRLGWLKRNNYYVKKFSYDLMGKLNREVFKFPQMNAWIDYTHDVMGNVVKEKLDDGNELRSTYNNINQLTRLSIVSPSGTETTIRTYTYDKWGRVSLISIGDGTNSIRLSYNTSHQLNKEEMLSGNTVLNTTDFVYDTKNRINKITETTSAGTKTRTYGYDANGQLTSYINEKGVSTTYTYDDAGNRTAKGNLCYVYDTTSNKLLRVTSAAGAAMIEFAYDSRGNMTSKNDLVNHIRYSYSYNNLNQMTGIQKTNTSTGAVVNDIRYTYDERGLMMSENDIIHPDPKNYIYDKQDRLVQITNATGQTITTYIYGGGNNPIAEQDSSGVITNFWNNYQGSVRGKFDSFGYIDLSTLQVYGPFGEPQNSGPEARYTGKLYNKNSNLYYFHARWYDPELGVFLTKDPAKPSLDNPTRLNPYNFCGNNPVNNVDPDGRLWWLIGAAIASWDWKRGHFKDFSKGQTWVDMGLGALGGEVFGASFGNEFIRQVTGGGSQWGFNLQQLYENQVVANVGTGGIMVGGFAFLSQAEQLAQEHDQYRLLADINVVRNEIAEAYNGESMQMAGRIPGFDMSDELTTDQKINVTNSLGSVDGCVDNYKFILNKSIEHGGNIINGAIKSEAYILPLVRDHAAVLKYGYDPNDNLNKTLIYLSRPKTNQ